MLRRDSGFDVDAWPGLEGLGYRTERTIVPRTAWWFPFDWMPAPRRQREGGVVEAWRRR
ncbi:MAG: hypothetical protein ACYTJ0_03690 [Planctomycetota bacterium]